MLTSAAVRVSRSLPKVGQRVASSTSAPLISRSVSSRPSLRRVSRSSTFRETVAWAGAAAGTALTLGLGVAFASDDALHPHHYHWKHSGKLSAYDSAALRRGYEVYRNVCSTCHSMNLVNFRNLVGVTHTEEQAKKLAESYDVVDGPNDEGEMFERPGKLSDKFPAPYPNEEAARFSNNGALPPDLSLIVKARHPREDYVFSLLTGYREPPAGVTLRDGLYYNPYMAGGAIAMAPPLSEGQVDYQDGTEASVSQMAKDVACFLAWASEPEADERKQQGFKWMTALFTMVLLTGYYKRFKWNILKNRKIEYI